MERALNADDHSLHPQPYWYVKANNSVYGCYSTEAEAVAHRKAVNKQYQTNAYYVEKERTRD
jgi:hypothetical protein